MKNGKYDYFRSATFIILIIAGIYTTIRAFLLSITLDEAVTMLVHIPLPFIEIIKGHIPIATNSHLLNTVLVKIFSGILGDSEFVMRIPSVISHFVFLFVSFKILDKITFGSRMVFGGIILCLNPFILDFFTVARGYSLAMCFLTLAVYHFICIIRNNSKTKDYYLLFIYSGISVLANVSFVTFYAAISIVLFISVIISDGKNTILKRLNKLTRLFALPFILTSVIFSAILYSGISYSLSSGEYYSGGVTGFYNDTILTLAKALQYSSSFITVNGVLLAAGIIMIASITAIIFHIIKNRNPAKNLALHFLALIISSYLLVEAQHMLIGIKYPIERTAIYFILLILFFIISSFASLKDRYSLAIFGIIALFLLFHFISTANFTHIDSKNFRYGASTKKVIDFLNDKYSGKGLEDNSITMGVDWRYQFSVNYYKKLYGMDFLAAVDGSGPDGRFDYYYLSTELMMDGEIIYENMGDKNVFEKYNLSTIFSYPTSRSLLAVPYQVII